MEKLLLHVCCANCGAVPVELLKDKFDITLFWYNPNIHPYSEYERRLKDVRRLATIYKVSLAEAGYEPEEWFKLIKGLEEEPEGGKRCEICFQMRLAKTAQAAKANEISHFATSLTIGPQKRACLINELGRDLAVKDKLNFLAADFKKKDGFKRSLELSKKYGFYRQNYCGCVFSKKS